ncbi:MAG TPA: FHA domain-containing protein [Planctomycetota bacterium]|nr:FHA domain-containing protein [Planctomycetota bacterium]
MRPRLIILKGSSLPREIVPEGEILEIGRSPEVGIVIADQSVSRRHAILRRDGETIVLEDLGSTFGTFVNEEPVPSGGTVRLEDGDVVRFGKVSVVCHLEDESYDAAALASDAAFAAQANARLVILEGELVRRCPIAGPFTRIGAAAHCEVRLQDRTGPLEAAILRAADGVFELVPRSRIVPPRLNEQQAPVLEATPLASGAVVLIARAQLLFLYDYAAGGKPVPDPLARVSRRFLLRHIAAQTRIAEPELKGLARSYQSVGQNLGEVLVEKGLVTPLFWRVICSRLPRRTSRWGWFKSLFHGGDQ